MGRPRRLKADRKTAIISVKATPAQKAELTRRASVYGLPLSSWLLMLGLSSARPT